MVGAGALGGLRRPPGPLAAGGGGGMGGRDGSAPGAPPVVPTCPASPLSGTPGKAEWAPGSLATTPTSQALVPGARPSSGSPGPPAALGQGSVQLCGVEGVGSRAKAGTGRGHTRGSQRRRQEPGRRLGAPRSRSRRSGAERPRGGRRVPMSTRVRALSAAEVSCAVCT